MQVSGGCERIREHGALLHSEHGEYGAPLHYWWPHYDIMVSIVHYCVVSMVSMVHYCVVSMVSIV